MCRLFSLLILAASTAGSAFAQTPSSPPPAAADTTAVCDPSEHGATVELPEGETPPYVTDLECLERLTHEAANAARREAGLAPLAWADDVAAVAQAHSEDMVRRGFVAHVTPDGVGPPQRLAAAGVDCSAGSAENIAFHSPVLLLRTQATAAGEVDTVVWGDRALAGGEPVAMWLDSPPHRRNLLNPDHTRHAIGFAYDEATQEYRVTQVLCV